MEYGKWISNTCEGSSIKPVDKVLVLDFEEGLFGIGDYIDIGSLSNVLVCYEMGFWISVVGEVMLGLIVLT